MKICETSKDQLPILGGFFIGVIEMVLLIVPLIVGLLIWYIALELSVAIRKKHEFMDWWKRVLNSKNYRKTIDFLTPVMLIYASIILLFH